MSTDTPPVPTPERDHLLSNEQYYLLNSLAVIILPALGTLYFALAQIWGLPGGEQVVGSIVAVDAFLGVIVKVGENSYNKSASRYSGSLNVSEQAEKTVYSLELNHAPEELAQRDVVTFKVNKPKPRPPAITYPLTPPPQPV